MNIYKTFTDYLPEIESDSFGKWVIESENTCIAENPFQMPYVSYSQMVRRFSKDVYNFVEDHPEYELSKYIDILKENDITWEKKAMQKIDVSALDGKCIMALLVGAVRAERFCDGALMSFFKDGTITKWLLRLKEISNQMKE